MAEMIIAVDAEKCTGCRICELACAMEKEAHCAPNDARLKIMKDEPNGINVPIVCQHCTDASCAPVCPLNLYYVSEENGAVLHNQEACIGCKACILACPYGAISMDRDGAKAVKCDLCDGDPQCVDFCPSDAIAYVRADEMEMMNKRKIFQRFSHSIREVRSQPEGAQQDQEGSES